MEYDDKTIQMKNWRRKVFVIGALVGALVGLGAAYLFTQKAEDPDQLPTVTSGDGVRLGLLVLGVLRSIVDLGEH